MVNSELVYEKPFYYGLIHVAFGFAAFHYTWVGIIFVMYQLLQLFLNKRFFVFQGKIKDGNSVRHTALKCGEFLVGMLLAKSLTHHFQYTHKICQLVFYSV